MSTFNSNNRPSTIAQPQGLSQQASNFPGMVFSSPQQTVYPSPQFIAQAPAMVLPPIAVPQMVMPQQPMNQFEWSQRLFQEMCQLQQLMTQVQQQQTGNKFEYFTDSKSTRVMLSASQNGIAELNDAPQFFGELPQSKASPPEDACVFTTKWSKGQNFGEYTAFIKETEYYDPSKDFTRQRRDSLVSSGSEQSIPNFDNSSVCSDWSHLSKGDLAQVMKDQIIDTFGARYKGREGAEKKEDKEGLRGEKVVRAKCTTLKALQHIQDFLDQLDDAELIRRLSCPVSRKRGGHINGFQCYIELKSVEDVEVYTREYEQFQRMNGYPLPKKIEHNPRSCAQKKADEERKQREAEAALRAQKNVASPPISMPGRCGESLDTQAFWDGSVRGYSPMCATPASCGPICA